jgi:hypothetical protein
MSDIVEIANPTVKPALTPNTFEASVFRPTPRRLPSRIGPTPSGEAADTVLVSLIGFFAIARKARLGKWPQMQAFVLGFPGC